MNCTTSINTTSFGGALRDIPKDGCEGDYVDIDHTIDIFGC